MSESAFRWSLTRAPDFPGAVMLLVEEREGDPRRGVIAVAHSRHHARSMLPELTSALAWRIARQSRPVSTFDAIEVEA